MQNDWLSVVERIGTEIARPHADAVDSEGRFPKEAMTALREAGLLAAAVPTELGGPELGIIDLCRMCTVLGQHCASTAMVLAMHHIQVLSIAHHRADSAPLARYLQGLVHEPRLIASVTSEVGPSGDMRTSVAAVELNGVSFHLTKHATTVSYGQHAEDLLISVRRAPDAAPSDQSLVLALRGGYELLDVGTWDTLGMRGTASPGATVRATGDAWQVMSVPFGDIATYTMVPSSHVLWSACWLGMATDAVAKAQQMVRGKARAAPGQTPRAASHLSALVGKLQLMRNEVMSTAQEYDELVRARNRERLASLAFALRVNNLKLTTSHMVVDIVTDALRIVGITGYKNGTPFSLGRHLRDAHSAALMINNDRIHETNASILLVHKGT
jgi:acyl-CoA dehydrogenase